jgi:tellurite resistance protein TehA-like permease
MIYRLVFYELADEAKPTIAIMVAPASLILMGYLSVFPEASVFICGILAGIAFLMTMFVYLALFRLLRLPFSPAFAALAFPLVTGGTALNRLARFMAERQGAELIGLLGKGTMIVAVGITVYVSVLYIREYWYRMAS